MDIVEYTVSEISFAVKRCVETTFSAVRVKGEIFGAKRADSGHWYLSLKDENAVLAAVCWRGVADDNTGRETVAHPMNNIADNRAGRAGNHPDNPRQIRNLLFMRGVKQTLAQKLLFTIFQKLQQRAGSGNFQTLNYQLIR